MTKNIVLIDGSYFIFYRYYALLQWWNISKQEPLLTNPFENDRFIHLYKASFIKKIKEISKQLKIPNAIYIVGKDCPRETIWRHKYIENYKGERKQDIYISHFFELVYNEKIFETSGISTILSYPELEADDCIALTCKYISHHYPEYNMYIIANDYDYIQVCNDKIQLYNLKYKKISPNTIEEAKKQLFCKIVMGDKSDNISSIFPKCGIQTAIKCYEDKDYFEKKNNTISKQLYERNKKIIDFDEIPNELSSGFFETRLQSICAIINHR